MKNVHFTKVKFEHTRFENIEFENCSFKTADFINTSFINCTGLQQAGFESSLRFDNECVFPDGIIVEHNDDYIKRTAQVAEPQIPDAVNV